MLITWWFLNNLRVFLAPKISGGIELESAPVPTQPIWMGPIFPSMNNTETMQVVFDFVQNTNVHFNSS